MMFPPPEPSPDSPQASGLHCQRAKEDNHVASAGRWSQHLESYSSPFSPPSKAHVADDGEDDGG
jgi:hypothetical protein